MNIPMPVRQPVPLRLDALPCQVNVAGFDEAYRLHQMHNHESVLLILLKLFGYALLVLGVGLLLFAPKTLMVSALYGPTPWQRLLLAPQLPIIGGLLLVGVVGWLQQRLDRHPLSPLAFFERHYLLTLDQPLPAGQGMQMRHQGGACFALQLVHQAQVPGEPS